MFGDCSVSKASVEASCQRMEQQLRSQTNTVKVVHQLRQVHWLSLPCMRRNHAPTLWQRCLYIGQRSASLCAEQRPTRLLRWGQGLLYVPKNPVTSF